MFGLISERQRLHPPRFRRRKRLAERVLSVPVQVMRLDEDTLRLLVAAVHQLAHLMDEIKLRPNAEALDQLIRRDQRYSAHVVSDRRGQPLQ